MGGVYSPRIRVEEGCELGRVAVGSEIGVFPQEFDKSLPHDAEEVRGGWAVDDVSDCQRDELQRDPDPASACSAPHHT